MKEIDQSDTQVSAIKVFSLFEKTIAEINEYPLCKDNLVVQRDAYKRLASIDEENLYEDEAAWDVFAEFEQGRKENDESMRFAVQFSAVGMMIGVEGMGDLFFEYNAFKNEKEVVRQIIDLLTMLANGQIALLHTLRNGRWCATEVLLYNKDKSHPMVLFSNAQYPRLWSKKATEGYDTQLMRNTYGLDKIEYPKDFLLVPKKSDGSFFKIGRELNGKELTPLTKGEYDAFWTKISEEIKIVEDGTSEVAAIMKGWEYWLVALLVLGGATATAVALDVPGRVYYLLPFAGMVASFIGAFVAIILYSRKAAYREYEVDHWLLKVDRFVYGNLRRLKFRVTGEKEAGGEPGKIRPKVVFISGLAASAMVGLAGLFFNAASEKLAEFPFWMLPAGVSLAWLTIAVLSIMPRVTPNVVNSLASMTEAGVALICFNNLSNDLFPGPAIAWVLFLTGLFTFSLITD
ncbi:MAG TPA: hypothetical protein VFM05_02000, partial [Candidatus Saccharimonadales bacterium]|nr:hypothetical protein [Candidatus Saccharimonadales bacterium]